MNTLNHYLTPRVKRYGIVLGTALILVALIFMTSKRQDANTPKPFEQTTSSVDFTGVPPKELTLNRISADLDRIHQQQKALHEEHQQEMERLEQEIHQLNQNEPPSQNRISAPELSEPEPVPDMLQWNQYSQPPTTNYNEPDYYDAPPQPPRPIRVLGAAYHSTTIVDPKREDKPKLLRLPAGSLLSGQLITGLDVPTGFGCPYRARRTTGTLPRVNPYQSFSDSAQPLSNQCQRMLCTGFRLWRPEFRAGLPSQ